MAIPGSAVSTGDEAKSAGAAVAKEAPMGCVYMCVYAVSVHVLMSSHQAGTFGNGRTQSCLSYQCPGPAANEGVTEIMNK